MNMWRNWERNTKLEALIGTSVIVCVYVAVNFILPLF